MQVLLSTVAGAVLLALISSQARSDLDLCLTRASFDTCHRALNR